jgi:hypothetical protein
LITVCLLLVWPVALLFPLDGHLHMGYIGSNVHHNATYILLKPLALLMLAQAVRIFDGQRRSWPGIILAAVVSAACTLAKPNFTVTILPAVALGVAYRLYRRQSVDWRLLLFGFGLPVAVVLLGQWPLFAALKGGLDFAPLKVMGGRSDYLLPKLILSILFPVSVYLAYFKNARQDVWLNLSWLAFLYGLAYTYLLAEDIAASHGNLTQSGRITMFVLFVVSALFVIRQGWSTSQATPRDRRFTLVVLLFGLHLISGLYWYVSQLQFDWWSWR